MRKAEGSPIHWVGGKSRLARWLARRLPDHDTYVEVFSGAAWLLFAKEPSRYEVLNDRSGALVNFWRVASRHPEELARVIGEMPCSRELFGEFARAGEAGLTDVERAARLYYLQKAGFSGKVTTRHFPVRKRARAKITPGTALADMRRARERLAGVVIENLDFEECVRRYDHPRTLFYLDPPYWGRENEYGKGLFGREDFARLARVLAGVRGAFVTSLNDRPEVREIFGDFHMETVELTYSVALGACQRTGELLISNRREA